MPIYFAYGSNMLPAQMADRCPGSRAVGTAKLSGWRFFFNTRGSAAIKPDAEAEVHGVLWRVDAGHINRLDHFEGVRWGNYHRRRIHVLDNDQSALAAVTYIGSKRYDGRPRINYIMTAVLPGAETFDLPAAYLDELRSWLPSRPIGNVSTRYRGGRKALRFPRQ